MSPARIDFKNGKVELRHGGGGRSSARLIDQLFLRYFDHPQLRLQNDQAIFSPPPGRLVISTDGHVVSPLFFPGGDIGGLAVHGTVNDVAMAGARPLYLTAGFILEEGLELAVLERIVASMAQAAGLAGAPIITGDTKVVERGKGDGVFITTTGIGVAAAGVNISAERAAPGCAILLSGSIGDHGMAIMAERADLPFRSQIQSDSAALHTLVEAMLQAAGPAIRCLRDPTRGGLASALNELARQSKTGMRIVESLIPVKPAVRAACEILGLDPLHVANEGKLICICDAEAAETLLAAMRRHPLGREAAIIGQVSADPHGFVEMQTVFGGRRIVDWLSGDQLPRIC